MASAGLRLDRRGVLAQRGQEGGEKPPLCIAPEDVEVVVVADVQVADAYHGPVHGRSPRSNRRHPARHGAEQIVHVLRERWT